ncbi:MAG: ABC transporter ATP-binding protein [Clostridiales bacterium]|nr:ABC transporter ATP-binding protein [Clostridiales bacterium]
MENPKTEMKPKAKGPMASGQQGTMKPKGKLMPIFKRLLRYIFINKKSMLLIISGLLLSSVLSLAPALLVKLALDQYLVPEKIGYLIAAGVAIIVAALLQALIDFATRYFSEINGQKAVYTVRRQVYSHLMELSFTYYDNVRTGDILSRITSDAETLQTFLGFAAVTIVSNMMFVAAVFIVMMSWSIHLSLLYLIFVPFIIFGIARYAFSLRPANSKLRVVLGKMSNVIQEQIRAMQLVKIFGREKHSVKICEKVNRQYMETGFSAGKITSFWMPYVFVFIGLSTGIILWYGGSKVVSGSISIGMLSGFITYMTMMMRPVRQTGMLTNRAVAAVAAAERIFEILDIKPEVENSPNAVELKKTSGLVEYKDVCFSYDKKTTVLTAVNFTAESGETVAIVGPSGTGKSTLMNLLPRFYDVDSGEILIDGKNIKDYTIESLRANIGIVLQQTFLFNLSIRENICFGKPDATMEEIRQAALAAQIDDFIMGLPDKYETMVGERGLKLSGGQRQRISIARTLLVDPPLLILDEPTASVDSLTDESIMTAIDNLCRGRTVFMIAHRLWTLKTADRILVLENGTVLQNGSHEELINMPGLYRDIFKLQVSSESYDLSVAKEGN